MCTSVSPWIEAQVLEQALGLELEQELERETVMEQVVMQLVVELSLLRHRQAQSQGWRRLLQGNNRSAALMQGVVK